MAQRTPHAFLSTRSADSLTQPSGAQARRPTSELPSFTHELAGTWYALGGKGLRDYTHAVETLNEPRLSVTYRYMHAT